MKTPEQVQREIDSLQRDIQSIERHASEQLAKPDIERHSSFILSDISPRIREKQAAINALSWALHSWEAPSQSI